MVDRKRAPGHGDAIRRRPGEGWLLGVCAGLAAHFDVAPWRVRALWGASVVVTAGLSAIAYVIVAALIPAADPDRR